MQDHQASVVVRELETRDWGLVAKLLGQEATYGVRLARHVEATYRPSFGLVVPTPDGAEIDAAIVAGVRRRSSDGTPTAVSVAWIGVRAIRRRQGTGRHLLNLIAGEATRLGARRLEATVEAADAGAVGFFHAEGFQVERRTAEVRISGDEADVLTAAPPPFDVEIRPLCHDELPSLAGLLIQLAVERATMPHDDLEGLTPAVLATAAVHVEHVGVAAWEADDPDAPVGIAWGLRTTHGVRMHFIGVHEASRRKGVGRALAGALLTTARRRAIFARVHEPLALHSFFVALGAVVTSETIDLGRPIERSASAKV